MRKRTKALKVDAICWLFPLLYSLMVWLTMSAKTEGTDFANQIYMLESVQNMPIFYMFFTDEAILFSFVYNLLYSIIRISPRLYIALEAFIYFSIILCSIERFVNYNKSTRFNRQSLSFLALFTCMCYSPSFICIARFHFAVTLLLIGVLFFMESKKRIWKVIGSFFVVLPYFAHEGIVIIYAIILLAYFLHMFWLSKSNCHQSRNILICLISLVLFILGPRIFSVITPFVGGYGLLSERYMDSYADGGAGDGAYLLVLVLSLFGSMLSLFITILYDHKNNWITAVCVSGLFLICLFYNQKFFYVQRIFMFMPLFIGLSCMQVLTTLKHGSKRQIYICLLLSVPSIYLCQLIIQRGLFFGA